MTRSYHTHVVTIICTLLRLIPLILFVFLFQGLPYIDLKIKWPNDLYVNGLKVGGILCTSTYRSKKFNVSAGNCVCFLFHLFFFYSPFSPSKLKLIVLLHQFEKPSVAVIYFNCCVLPGIGLNVDNEKPTTCLNEALTNLSSTPYKLRREDILAFFFNKFENLYDIFINQGIYMSI